MRKDTIILFSGGMDSTVLLALALSKNKSVLCLSFDYGQRHLVELEAAKKIADYYQVDHLIAKIDPCLFAASALTSAIQPAKGRTQEEISTSGIPNTEVPARNQLFLASALCQAELYLAREILFGSNALDQHPYPDCRPQFIEAFNRYSPWTTDRGLKGETTQVVAPFMEMTKKDIATLGRQLNAPLELSFSCYSPSVEGISCQECDACTIRLSALCVA